MFVYTESEQFHAFIFGSYVPFMLFVNLTLDGCYLIWSWTVVQKWQKFSLNGQNMDDEIGYFIQQNLSLSMLRWEISIA